MHQNYEFNYEGVIPVAKVVEKKETLGDMLKRLGRDMQRSSKRAEVLKAWADVLLREVDAQEEAAKVVKAAEKAAKKAAK